MLMSGPGKSPFFIPVQPLRSGDCEVIEMRNCSEEILNDG
jgi:hypothetical protein